MRILIITDQPIDPPMSGGAERVRTLAERLARRHDVELVNLVGFREEKGTRRITPRLSLTKIAAYQRTFSYYLERLHVAPAFIAHYAHALVAPLYARIVRRNRWDVVQVDGVALSPYLRLSPRGTVRIYSAHNVESEYYQAMLDLFPLRRPLTTTLRRIESAALRAADAVFAVSDRDRDLLASLYSVPRERIVTVPNGFDEDRFRPPALGARERIRAELGLSPRERVALFAGSRVPHNEAAVRFLLGSVAPRLPEGVRLLIAGAVGDAFPFAGTPRVIITGSVPDVLPYFHAADLAVNPIVSGGGTNIKVLQYLATGLPVLSSPFGMRGLDALAPFVRIVGEEEITAAIGRPLAPLPPGARAELASMSWTASAGAMEACYERLAAATKRRAVEAAA